MAWVGYGNGQLLNQPQGQFDQSMSGGGLVSPEHTVLNLIPAPRHPLEYWALCGQQREVACAKHAGRGRARLHNPTR